METKNQIIFYYHTNNNNNKHTKPTNDIQSIILRNNVPILLILIIKRVNGVLVVHRNTLQTIIQCYHEFRRLMIFYDFVIFCSVYMST